MSIHLIPSYHRSSWFPFSSFNNDLRQMRKMLDISDPTGGTSQSIEPSYSYHADDRAAYFEIEMPGVSKGNISIEVEGFKLIVKGKRFRKQLTANQGTTVEEEGQKIEKASENTVNVKKAEPIPFVYLLEARLAQSADIDDIKADHCGDGILTITIPMKANHGARKIQIGL